MRRLIGKTTNGHYVGEASTAEQQASFLEMLASRCPPGIDGTDAAFTADFGTLNSQFGGDERQLEIVTKAAKRQGYRPSASDIYMPSLAERVGDPAAFVPAGNARYHIRRVAEARDLELHGRIERKRSGHTPRKQDVSLAPDLVEHGCQAALRRDPGLKRLPKRELRELVIARHGKKPAST